MTYRSFRKDKHLENGEHIVFLDSTNKHIMYHTSRFLKKRYKINIVNAKINLFKLTYETTYYPDKHMITLNKNISNEEYTFLLDYYQKYINTTIDKNYFVIVML
jgi:hypothetical protein